MKLLPTSMKSRTSCLEVYGARFWLRVTGIWVPSVVSRDLILGLLVLLCLFFCSFRRWVELRIVRSSFWSVSASCQVVVLQQFVYRLDGGMQGEQEVHHVDLPIVSPTMMPRVYSPWPKTKLYKKWWWFKYENAILKSNRRFVVREC